MKMNNWFLALLMIPIAAGAAGWTPELTIKVVATDAVGSAVWVETTGHTSPIYGACVVPNTNPWVYTNCTANKFSIKATDAEGLKRVYSALLTAYASGSKIKIWVNDEPGLWMYHSAGSIKIGDFQ